MLNQGQHYRHARWQKHFLIVKTLFQVVGAANDLGKEMDPGNFFAAYSQVNNSLEQMFIDLLLLMDSCKTGSKQEKRAVVDLSGVIEALKAVTLKQSEGTCVCVEYEVSMQYSANHVFPILCQIHNHFCQIHNHFCQNQSPHLTLWSWTVLFLQRTMRTLRHLFFLAWHHRHVRNLMQVLPRQRQKSQL